MATLRDNGMQSKEAAEIMEIFNYSYTEAMSDLARLELLQQQYDNITDESTWPTISRIPIPIMFTTVEKTLPDIFEYLFPSSNFVRLYPLEPGLDIENVRRAETAIYQTLVTKMRIQNSAYPSIKDCFKLGLGYGIVEPHAVTPPALRINALMRGTEKLSEKRIIVPGKRYLTTRYRYLTPGQIITYPDGSNFNGDNKVSWSFFLDSYSEVDFKNMYEDQPTDGEIVKLKGSPVDIIKQAGEIGFFSNVPIVDMVAALGGINLEKLKQKYGKTGNKMPVRVPVLKCYAADRHVWIANGTTIIFDEKEKYQTMRCPLVKASCWPDGLRWYPMSTPEAAQNMSVGTNLWINALYDLMTYRIKPVAAYNKRVIDKTPERGPQSDIAVDGPVNEAFAYMPVPQMDNGLFNVGDIMQRQYNDTVGQSMGAPSPGMLRGGVYAFESLLQSTTGRARLAGAILETGFLQEVAYQTLINMQLTIDSTGELFIMRQYDANTGKDVLRELRVTEADIVNAFDLTLSLRAKSKRGMADAQRKLSEWNAFKDEEAIDKYEFLISRFEDEEEAMRFVLPREKVREMQKENRQVGMAERAAGIQEAMNRRQSAGVAPEGLETAAMGAERGGPQGPGGNILSQLVE